MASTKDLIKAGLLEEGDILVWKRRVQGVTLEALILKDGLIETKDGKKHKTPSGAAKHLNRDKPVDGWIAWKVQSSGASLAELRKRLT